MSVELVIPTTGEVVDVSTANGVALAVRELDELAARIRDLKAELVDRARFLAETMGSKTLHTDHGKLELSGGSKVVWDVGRLREGLEKAGCPDSRINDLIAVEQSFKVNASVAKQLASSPLYAEAVAAARSEEPVPWRVSVR